MKRLLKISIWTIVLLTLGLISAVVSSEEVLERSKNDTEKIEPVIFVTPEPEEEEYEEDNEDEEDEEDVAITTVPPATIPLPKKTEPTVRTTVSTVQTISRRHDDGDDLARQSSRVREPARSPPLPVLSSTEDFTLNSPEVDDKSGPVAYETIVYDPDTRDATAAFSRSQIWTTPELTIKDTVQRQEGKNSLMQSSSRLEYTPNYESAQTPLNQIRYSNQKSERRQYTTSSDLPFQRTTSRPFSPPARQSYERNSVDEDEVEEESRPQAREVEDKEEYNEEESEDEEEKTKKRYPVRLQEESFDPFAGVGGPDDIYSDVLNNIGSVFNEDGNSNDRELAPEFEKHNYENRQKQDRGEEQTENEGVEEDNEEIVDYDDDGSEGVETKQNIHIPTSRPPPPPPRPHNQYPYKPQNQHQQQQKQQRDPPEQRLAKSPFPNVKIIRNQNQESSNDGRGPSTPKPFSPWLPAQKPIYNTPNNDRQQSHQNQQEPKKGFSWPVTQQNTVQKQGSPQNSQPQKNLWQQTRPPVNQEGNKPNWNRPPHTNSEKNKPSWHYSKPKNENEERNYKQHAPAVHEESEESRPPPRKSQSYRESEDDEEEGESYDDSNQRHYEDSTPRNHENSYPPRPHPKKSSNYQHRNDERPSKQYQKPNGTPKQKSWNQDEPYQRRPHQETSNDQQQRNDQGSGKPYHESYNDSYKKSWSHSTPKKKESNQSPPPQQKIKNDGSEKPYQESFSKSYENSWKHASPKKQESTSYSNSWEENKPVTKYKSNQGQSETSAHNDRTPKPKYQSWPQTSESQASRKVPRESPAEAKESEEINVSQKPPVGIFVTTVPEDLQAEPTEFPGNPNTNDAAVHDIDDMYAKQSDSL